MGAVSSAGVFTPAGAGNATILATSTQDTTKSGSATVTVTAPSTITSVSVVCSPTSIQTTQTSACGATVQGTGNFNTSVSWSASPTSIGTVSSSGVFAPSGSGTATITAISTQDSSKSGTAAVTVTAQSNVSIAPRSAQVQVFHSQQFSATVNGSASTAVTWAVNGVAGGNLTVGQIDSTGLYVAPNTQPSSSGVIVTVASQADSTQTASAAVTILPDAAPPSITTVSPGADQTAVALDSTIQVQFSDALDPSTVNNSTFVVTSAVGTAIPSSVSYSPADYAVTIVPQGVLSPGVQYTITVSNAVADPAGESIPSTSVWSFTTQDVTTANGVVPTSVSSDPKQLTVVSYSGQETTPDSSGGFTASIIPLGSSLVAAMVPGKNFGWMAFAADQTTSQGQAAVRAARQSLASRPPTSRTRSVFVTRYQITSSVEAASNSTSITTDATTTAESLLFMTPYFYTSDPTLAPTIQMTIAQDTTVPALAQALQSAQTITDPISDPTVQSALQASIKSIYATLTSTSSGAGTAVSSDGSQLANQKAGRLSSGLTAQAATSSLSEEATPYCHYGNSNAPADPNNLQCLDLDFIQVTPQSYLGGYFNTTISNNNCAHDNVWDPSDWFGCDVDFLIMIGPNDGSWSPSGGVDSIKPQTESGGGVYSPLGNFDPLCTVSNVAGCLTVRQMDGFSTFERLDVAADLSAYLSTGLGVESSVTTTIQIPYNVGNYVVRAYSGGVGDFTELSDVLSEGYDGNSRELWLRALANNLGHSAIDVIEPISSVLGADQNQLESCLFAGIGNAATLVESLSQYQDSNWNSAIAFQQSIQFEINYIVSNFVGAAAGCGVDPAKAALMASDKDLLTATFAKDIVVSLQAAGGVGAAAQRIGQLMSASPLETAIISVQSNTATGPVVTGVAPSPVPAVDGSQPVTIVGTGFLPGAMVFWQNSSGNTTGPFTPTTPALPSSIAISNNFGSQTATWHVQVVNPNGTLNTNWFPFQVTASTTTTPDLVPQGVTLSGYSAAAGSAVTVNFTVLNQGNGAAPASTTGFRIGTSSTTPPGPSGDIPNSFISTPALSADKSVQQSQMLTIPSSTSAGTYYIWVVVDDVVNSALGQSDTSNDYASSPALTITRSQTLAPVISGVGPNPVPGSNTAQTLTINGTNFVSGAALTFHDPQNTEYLRSATFVSSNQLTHQFNDANEGGDWTVQVTNPDGQISKSFGFTVSGTSSVPSLNSLSTSPNPSVAGQQFLLTVNGSNFDPSSVQILITGSGCAPCAVLNAMLTGKTTTQAVGPVTLNSPGSYTVTVQNGSAGTQSNSLSLTVGGITPALSSLSTSPSPPLTGQQFTLTLNGSNFDPSSVQILIFGGSCGPCTIANGTLTTKTVAQVGAPVTLSAAGSYNITVQNGSGGGQSNILTLVIGTPTPSLNSLTTTPSSPAIGQQFTINISGSNFDPSSVQVLFTGPGCAPCTIPNASLTTKNATLLIGPTTLSTAGSYSVSIQNSSSGTQSNSLPLTIGAVTPSLSTLSTSPNPPVTGQQFTLTLNGSNFTPSSVQILIYGGSCGPCTIANGILTTETATQVAAPVTLSTAGSYNIYAQNGAGGGQSNSLTLVIGTPTPTLTALVTSPSSPAAGQQFTIDISGNNFDPSTVQVLFTGPGCTPCTIANASLTTKNAALLIGPTTLSTAGNYAVTVQNGSSGTQSNSLPLTVGAVTPSLSSLSTSPNPPVAGQQFILTLNGSSFDPNSVQILINGTGCAPCIVNNAVLSTKTAAQVVGPVTLNSPGNYTVTVQNGSSGTQSNDLGLTIGGVTPALSSLSTSPSPPLANQQFMLTLNGSNFDPNSVQVLINGGSCGPCTIVNGSLTAKTANQVVAPVTLNTAGSYNITVQNGAGGGQSNALTLVIGTPTPSLNQLVTTPSSPAAGQQFTINLSGNNFDPSSVQILFTGPGCAPCTIPNANLTTKNATLLIGSTTLAAAGSYTVTVQNGSSGTQSNGLPLTIGALTPLLTSLSTNPSSPVAGQQFTLTLNGTNLTPSSVQILIYGGSCGPCTIANGTLTTKTASQVVAPVTLSTAGSYNIYAQNGLGGGQSNSLTLVIGTPTPSLTDLVTSPSSPTAAQQFTIDISGNNFDPSGVQILFTGPGCAPCTISNGSLTTKNATLLIGSTTLSNAGNFTVTVQNGSSGTQSNGLPLTIGTAGNKFTIGETVMVSGTGGVGLNLRSCANTTCSLLVNMPDGTVMQVIGGPTTAAGYTWWELSGKVGTTSYTGWAVQDYMIAD
jgi:hypothetical protein